MWNKKQVAKRDDTQARNIAVVFTVMAKKVKAKVSGK